MAEVNNVFSNEEIVECNTIYNSAVWALARAIAFLPEGGAAARGEVVLADRTLANVDIERMRELFSGAKYCIDMLLASLPEEQS